MAYARDAGNWHSLAAADVCQISEKRRDLDPLGLLIERTLHAVHELEACAGEGTDRELGDQLGQGVRLEDELERRTGQLLRQMNRYNDWRALGFFDLSHYAAERLGMARRTARSRTGIAHALCDRPVVRAAYEKGTIGLEAAWIICRALDRDPLQQHKSEWAWVELARESSVKRLQDEVRRAGLCRMEAFRDGPAKRTTDFGNAMGPATDAEWHAFIRREPEMTRVRVRWLGKAGLHPNMADVCLRLRLQEDIANNLLAAIESARRRLQEMDPRGGAADTRSSGFVARDYIARGRRVPAWVGLLDILEEYAETWDDPNLIPKRRWSRIYERDGYRCMAPGCTARAQIQDHHIHYRSHQGSDEPWNQLTLCAFHHQQGEHGRFARVRGTAPLDLIWRLGTPELATWWKNERRLKMLDRLVC
jgi:hypothetical protein